MALLNQRLLDQVVQDLGVTYPTWLFDPDDSARPRKLAGIPPGSRPAQILGWKRWYWEYGMNMDMVRSSVRKVDSKHKLPAAKEVLSRMQYDEEYNTADYRVVFKHEGDVKESVDLPDWYEDAEHRHQQRPIQRIERKWDDLPMWDAETKADLVKDPDAKSYVTAGLAIPVESCADLAKKARPDRMSAGDHYMPQKAQFEFVDEEGGVGRGVVFNGRSHKTRGIVHRADFDYNNQFLVGTAYENLSREEKIKFFGMDRW